MGDQRLSSRTAQRAIRLKSKVLTREAASFPRQSHGGFRISLRGRRRVSRLFVHRRESRSKLGPGRRLEMKLMIQIQTPDSGPMSRDPPATPPKGTTTPPTYQVS